MSAFQNISNTSFGSNNSNAFGNNSSNGTFGVTANGSGAPTRPASSRGRGIQYRGRGKGRGGNRGGFSQKDRNDLSSLSVSNPFQQQAGSFVDPMHPPTTPGFKPRPNRIPRETPPYLLHGQTSVQEASRPPDSWDLQNQKAILDVENQLGHDDLQQLYEKVQAMREVERAEMEKRGLVDKQDVKKNLKDAILFIGTCMDMCPAFERIRRTYENNVKQLEKDPITGKVDRKYAVKAFSRPAAGQPPPLPSDVRPPAILRSTLYYLIENVVPKLPASHSFLWDRTRSIRQDFTYQNYSGDEAIECNELIARIHIACLHIMAGADIEYSKQQELEQFNKTLQTLTEFYTTRRQKGLGDSIREPEIRAYQLLSHLKDPDIERQVQSLPRHIFDHPHLQLALKLRGLIQHNNNNNERGFVYNENASNLFASFFKLVASSTTPFLFACLLESNFNDMRLYALKSMARSYHNRGKPFQVSRLTSMLGFDGEQETVDFCIYYRLTVSDDVNDGKCIDLTSWNDSEIAEKLPLAQPCSKFIDNKLKGSLADLILRGEDQMKVLAPAFPKTEFNNIIVSSTRPPAFGNFQTLPKSESIPSFFGQSKPALAPIVLAAAAPVQKTPAFTFGQSRSTATPVSSSTSSELRPLANPFAVKSPQPNVFETAKMSIFPKPSNELSPFSVPVLPETSATLTRPIQSQQQLPLPKISPPTETRRPQQVPVPIPVPVIPGQTKPQPIIYSGREMSDSLQSMLRKSVLQSLRNEVIPAQWNSILQARTLRQNVLSSTANDIFGQLIGELLFKRILQTHATVLNSTRLKRRAIKLIAQTGAVARDLAETKRKLKLEYETVSQLLGRQKHIRRNSGQQSLRRRRVSEQNEVDLIRKAREESVSMWQPFDLNYLLLDPIENAFKTQGSLSRRVKCVVFCSDWNDTTGNWLRQKLGLQWNGQESSTFANLIKNKSTEIPITALEEDPKSYREVGLVIIECGKMDSSYDQGAVTEILTRLKKNSIYRQSVLLVNWNQTNEEEFLSQLSVSSEISSELDKVVVCTMTRDFTASDFETGLTSLARSFTAKLSTMGEIERQKTMDHRRELAERRQAQREEERKMEEAQQREQRFKRIQSMNSLHLFKEAVVPMKRDRSVSAEEKENNLLNAVVIPGVVQPIMSKGLRELKSLVSSITKKKKLVE